MVSTRLKDGLAAYKRGDYATALQILRPMANNGDAIAQYTLGIMYVQAEGVPEDWAEVVKWYRMAADGGHADAQRILGDWYSAGGDDEWEAVKWYRKAAEHGHPDAQFKFGRMYEDHELLKDPAEAVKWYRKAATQGQIDAQRILGLMYASGDRVTEDLTEAAKWLRKAADQGDTDAQYELGKMYEEGFGVRRDAVQAYKWFFLAALSHDPPAIADRDSVAANMTPAQISEAQRLAREWKPT